MNALIIDDEELNIDLIVKLLEKFPFIENVKTASSVIEALKVMNEYQADLIFLDVEMPGGTGFDFLELLPNRNPKVIFVTAHEKYAIKALRANAHDYLLKPIDVTLFNQLISKLEKYSIEESQKSYESNRIVVSTMEETYFIKPKNIIRISSAGSYCIYHLSNGKEIVASHVLKKASEQLPMDSFIRVHNSVIINIRFIEKIDKMNGNTIVLSDGSKVPVSRRRKEEFLKLLSKK